MRPPRRRLWGRRAGSSGAGIVGEALFPDNGLEANEIVALSTLEGWVKVSVHRRPARYMSRLVADKAQWVPPNWAFDVGTKSWARVCALRDYAAACGELDALREALKAAEHFPVDNIELLHRGLALVEESLQRPQQFIPSSTAA